VTMLEDTPNGIHRIQLSGTGAAAAKPASVR